MITFEEYQKARQCVYCKKRLDDIYNCNIDTKVVGFCDKECLDQYCDKYMQDNWKDYAYMMGVTIRD